MENSWTESSRTLQRRMQQDGVGEPVRVFSPQPRAVPVPDAADQLPTQWVLPSVTGWVLGVHGGAGESTIARLTGARGCERHWPMVQHGGPRQRVALVARTHEYGLRRAQRAVQQWAAGQVGHVHLVGLVLVADAPGRLPRPLREMTDLLAGAVAHLWRVPWVESLRVGAGDPAVAPARLVGVLKQLRVELEGMGVQ